MEISWYDWIQAVARTAPQVSEFPNDHRVVLNYVDMEAGFLWEFKHDDIE